MPIDSIKWGKGRKEAFVAYFDADFTESLAVHDNLVKVWIRWLELYRAPVKQPERNIPYEGAANFMLPTIATDADQLFAKFMQSIHATENVWTTQALNERWVDAAKPLQDFLTWLDGSLLHMYDVNKRVVAEMVKLGTGIYKTGWHYERRPIWTYDQSGKVVKAEKITGRPLVDHVRLADFVFPPNAYSIDPDEQGGAPWVAERMRVPVDRLRWMADAANPYLPNLDKEALGLVIQFEEKGSTEYDAALQQNDYTKTATTANVDWETESGTSKTSEPQGPAVKVVREIELWEVHARFPTGSNDSQDDVIIWYHKPTQKIVRGIYQYYHHGKRPYEVVRYFPGDGFYGIGVCEQTEVFQSMDSDLFNFTWDNVFLANSRMIVAKGGANIAPGEPYWPGKVWITDGDVRQDFTTFPMADIYQSLPLLSEAVIARKERRNGIGDLQLGNMQSLPSRTPATTTLSLLQEGSRRPDLTLKDMRYSGLSRVGLRVLQLCQQFMASPQDVGGKNLLAMAVSMLGQPEGQEAAKKLLMPMENVEMGLGCSITATSGSKNKETAKQDYLALMQVAGQTTQQLVQLAQVATQFKGTPIAQMATDGIVAQLRLGKRLLEQYDIPNIDEIIPDPPAQQVQAQAPGLPAGPAGLPAGLNGAGGGLPPGTPFDPSVANLYGGANRGLG